MSERYLKQVIVVRKDLMLTQGKLAAMVAHAAMTFITEAIKANPPRMESLPGWRSLELSAEQIRWLTELDPGLEAHGQVSFAKIVVQVADEAELLTVEQKAKDAGLCVHRVIDSGYTHVKPGTFVCIAVGPDWPEKLEPVTGGLKVYR